MSEKNRMHEMRWNSIAIGSAYWFYCVGWPNHPHNAHSIHIYASHGDDDHSIYVTNSMDLDMHGNLRSSRITA